jgi:hypothetical protein
MGEDAGKVRLTGPQRNSLRQAARHPRGHVGGGYGDSRTDGALLRKRLIKFSHELADGRGVYKITDAGRRALVGKDEQR